MNLDAKRNRTKVRRALVKITGGCNIQHDGWPCNSCFHSIDVPGLSRPIHDYWTAVLAYRGDYPPDPRWPDVIRNTESDELVKELYTKIIQPTP